MAISVFIEVSKDSNVKYEHNKDENRIECDRVLFTPMAYPYNYGYFPGTEAGDGDPLDVMVVTNYPLLPGCYIKCKILGVLYTKDEKGTDEKIIAVPIESVDPYMKTINDLFDLKHCQLDKIKFFFENYKKLENNKWVEVTGWGNKEAAMKVYEESIINNL